MALINKDDEMIIFEPAFPMYIDHCELSGGTLKTVPLNVNEEGIWVFDKEQLRKTLNEKTKLLVLNTPHNPTGKCFTREE